MKNLQRQSRQGKYKRTAKIILKVSGPNNYAWKGEKASYFRKHAWLRKHYGKATKCFINPLHTSKKFEWACILGKGKSSRNIDDYIQLCCSCHKYFDKGEFCSSGHKFDEKNTVLYKGKHRRCRICMRAYGKLPHVIEYRKKWKERKKLKSA